MLQWWLESRWGKQFSFESCTLEHGRQHDTFSCAFATINMLAHEALDEPLWNESQRATYRIRWFNRLLEEGQVVDRVSVNPKINGDVQMEDISLWQSHASDDGWPSTTITTTPEISTSDPEIGASSLLGVGDIASKAIDGLPLWSADGPGDSTAMVNRQCDTAEAIHGVDAEKPLHPFFSTTAKRKQTAKRQSDGGDGKEKTVKRLRPSPAPCDNSIVGISKSSVASRKLNAQVGAGGFVPNPKRLATFKAKIQELDARAEFDNKDVRSVRHSKCGEFKQMREPYHIGWFKTHVSRCKGPKVSAKLSGGGMPTIETMLKGKWMQKPVIVHPNPKPLCPGLTDENDKRISTYLTRTASAGGGASSRSKLLSVHFPDVSELSKLDDDQKIQLYALERSQWIWRNEADLGKIYAKSCLQVARLGPGTSNAKPLACLNCMNLFQNPTFKSAISRPLPLPENLKYTPKIWRESADDASLIEKYGSLGLKEIVRAYKDVRLSIDDYHRSITNGFE
jgi:hypothetical protein